MLFNLVYGAVRGPGGHVYVTYVNKLTITEECWAVRQDQRV